ncbi:RNA ligase-domain-containing protein [Lactarius akahatsu]|uniref:tRNA ligase n=1 Tax=Lactarius akahatsu TaxID=416441 RepID=A0AAD4L6N0_9AGAM|nr:RNA ligase-domain-containing protein [Lactarius akahatsu]
MATRSFSQEDSQLIADLHSLNKKSPKLVKFVQYAAPALPDVAVESWKMNEFKYYDVPSPFPTLARGLFSTKENGAKVDEPRYRIVARGYDKFFNIGEVPWTTWSSLEAHTKPPYTLTLKSNGCIIFVAALSPSKLLVTSKHSVGPVQGSPESHAQAGERWLHHHLKQAGKTTEQLAETLWAKNWTVAAELCDDGFEEHVLPYSTEKTGLHLHGINECSRHFRTQPTAVVEAFAREWGFIPTPSLELPSVQDVKTFTEEIGRNGTWNGEALEGFVVRSTVTSSPTDRRADGRPPYAAGSSFFFKVKFDEPYMMYRDWREITKALLARGEGANLPKSKMARSETKVYVKWVKDEIKKHPELFEGYTKGHGIIATRERFLRWLETGEGERDKEKVESAERVSAPSDKKFGKTIIMPVAVPGVGKTTVAVALAELFQFGHTQSDDVRAKKRGPAFIQNVKKLLRDHDVVIADKNNHLHVHRQDLRNAVKGMHPPVRLLALNWSLDQPHAEIHRICADRIMARGTNHQTLHGDEQGKAHESVLWRFLIDTEPLADDEADTVIEMDTREDLEHALSRAVDAVVRVLGLPRPDAERVGAALARARGYRPARTDAEQQRKRHVPPRYFGMLAEIDLVSALDAPIASARNGDAMRMFWDALKARSGVARRPHVTIVHSKQLPECVDLWERCTTLYALPAPPLFRARLGHVVANERIMAATVEDLRVDDPEAEEAQAGTAFVSQLGHALRDSLHVTIGLRDADVLPVEAGALVASFRKGAKGVQSVSLENVFIRGRIQGLFS